VLPNPGVDRRTPCMRAYAVHTGCIRMHTPALGRLPPPSPSRNFPEISPFAPLSVCTQYALWSIYAFNMHQYARVQYAHVCRQYAYAHVCAYYAHFMRTDLHMQSICAQTSTMQVVCASYALSTCFPRICTHIRVYALDMHFFRRYASICIKYADIMHFLFFSKKKSRNGKLSDCILAA
jgi:hypothetical protein